MTHQEPAQCIFCGVSVSGEAGGKGVKAGGQCECAVNLGENLVLFRLWQMYLIFHVKVFMHCIEMCTIASPSFF